VVSDVPEEVTVVGIPAKVVRVHGKKDDLVIHQIEEERETLYYTSKLEKLKDCSHHSSHL
ncbi:serine O-acetyltransferase, partial [Streptococcus pyogenes]